MFGLTYEDIVKVIKTEKGLSEEEIKSKVQEKLTKLSDLISKEGAAHILANELGINLFDRKISKIKINKLLPGMRSVNILGKVVKLYGIREFKTDQREGKVANLLFGDETGVLRLVLWDTKLISKLENDEVKEGSVIRVKNAYVKQNNGYKELHLGSQGELALEDAKIKVADKGISEYVRKEIGKLEDGMNNVGVFGTIVQAFEPRFYDACPDCGKKATEGKCKEHGEVISKKIPILNIFLDDGTGNIRAVAFRDQVFDLTEIKEKEFVEGPELFESIKETILGKQVLLVGRIVKNEMFDRLEFMVQRVVNMKPEDIIKEMQNDV